MTLLLLRGWCILLNNKEIQAKNKLGIFFGGSIDQSKKPVSQFTKNNKRLDLGRFFRNGWR